MEAVAGAAGLTPSPEAWPAAQRPSWLPPSVMSPLVPVNLSHAFIGLVLEDPEI